MLQERDGAKRNSERKEIRETGDIIQGAKKIIFTACHSGKLKLAFTSPDVISTSNKKLFVLLLFKFLIKHHLPFGQVKNRIH